MGCVALSGRLALPHNAHHPQATRPPGISFPYTTLREASGHGRAGCSLALRFPTQPFARPQGTGGRAAPWRFVSQHNPSRGLRALAGVLLPGASFPDATLRETSGHAQAGCALALRFPTQPFARPQGTGRLAAPWQFVSRHNPSRRFRARASWLPPGLSFPDATLREASGPG